MSEEDKETLEKTVSDALEWLDENAEAETDDYKAKQKEVEKIANPIIQDLYQKTKGSGGGGDEGARGAAVVCVGGVAAHACGGERRWLWRRR